jgi:DNA-binding transcriptional LysR family regulator
MHDLNDLYYFAMVADHHGFAPAARALGLPKSTLSRRVAKLEDRLGVRLIERSTRRFAVTEVGQAFYVHCKAVIAEAEAAEEAAARLKGEPRGVVRLSAPIQMAQGALASILPRFLAAYPLVRVQLSVTNRRIDLIEDGVDIALRVRTKLDTDADLKMRVLGREQVRVVASPDLVRIHGLPQEPADLAGFPTVSHTEALREVWRLTAQDGREYAFEHEPRLAAGDFETILAAAVAGLGVAYLPEMVCAPALRAGALVQLLPEWGALQGVAHLVFTTRRGQLPAVSALIDFLVENLPTAYGFKR